MKNKLLLILTSLMLICLCLFGLTACNDNEEVDGYNQDIVAIYNTYVAYAEERGVTPLSYEDWLASIKGDKGDKGDTGAQGVGIADIYVADNGDVMVKYTNANEYVVVGNVKPSVQTESQLKFVMNTDGKTVSVDGIGMYFERDLIIPSTYKGYAVTGITDNAFENCEFITSVTIPDSVTSIGDYAFYGCKYLTSVSIGDGVTSIGDYTFAHCESLTSINIPNSVTSIAGGAFFDCKSLTSVTIGSDVTSIGSNTFAHCNSLTEVNYMGVIDNWAQIKFADFGSNPLYYAKKLHINDVLVTEANFTTATKINATAFFYCDSLTSVTIGNSVSSIGSFAFAHCESLTSINIPNSVTSIDYGAFDDCTSLEYNIKDNLGYLGNENNPYLFLICLTSPSITNATIDENCKYIVGGAFVGCASLTSVIIPNSVTDIGSSAFSRCNSLKSVTICNGVQTIGSGAFDGCTSLTSVVIPNSVTEIGALAFDGCTSLTSITFSDTSTWYRTDNYDNWINKTSGTQTDLTTPTTNDDYFKSSYYDYYWYKL